MREVTKKDYEEFIKKNKEIFIEDVRIKVGEKFEIKKYHPEKFELEKTNVWSFPERGDWATHRGDFRGNWPPQLVRNIILRYSKPRETVLDQMCGSGTTLIECKLLGRNAIGVDINYEACILTIDRLNFENPDPFENKESKELEIKVYHGDARNLNLIRDESVDLIATHPPYFNIITYSKKRKDDLSKVQNLEEYLKGMHEVAEESFRVLKPGRYCAILVGDTRMHRHHVPIAFRVMQEFLDVGFVLKEDVVKIQWKMKGTREKWEKLSKVADECWIDIDEEKKKSRKYTDFYLLCYEHLFIFRKPETKENLKKVKNSLKWWS